MTAAAGVREMWCQHRLDAEANAFAGLYYAGFDKQTEEQRDASAHFRLMAATHWRLADYSAAVHATVSAAAANCGRYAGPFSAYED